MESPDRVLVPFVNPATGATALDYALDIHPEAEITVLAVRTPLDEPLIKGGVLSLDKSDRATPGEDIADRIAGKDDRHRITVTTAEGRPAATIVDRVATIDLEHVVMSERDYSRLEQFVFGRTIADIVDAQTDTPVTVVRPSRADRANTRE